MNSCNKYWWIYEHPAFLNRGGQVVEIEITPHMICKETDKIENFKPLNQTLQLWVEMMIPYYDVDECQWRHKHDMELDCGGFTWEEAIDNLYLLVLEHYGDYTDEDIAKKHDEIYKIKHQVVMAKSRRVMPNYNWHRDIIAEEMKECYPDEIQNIEDTINALTNYKKTCNIEDHYVIDIEIEKEQFRLYEWDLSYKTGINLIRK